MKDLRKQKREVQDFWTSVFEENYPRLVSLMNDKGFSRTTMFKYDNEEWHIAFIFDNSNKDSIAKIEPGTEYGLLYRNDEEMKGIYQYRKEKEVMRLVEETGFTSIEKVIDLKTKEECILIKGIAPGYTGKEFIADNTKCDIVQIF